MHLEAALAQVSEGGWEDAGIFPCHSQGKLAFQWVFSGP
jgi:hypothetical protein